MDPKRLNDFKKLCNEKFNYIGSLVESYLTNGEANEGRIKSEYLPAEYLEAYREFRQSLPKDNEIRIQESVTNFLSVVVRLLNLSSESKSPEKLVERNQIVRAISESEQEIENFLAFLENESVIQNNISLLNHSLASQNRNAKDLEARLQLVSQGLETITGPINRKLEEIELEYNENLLHLAKKRKEIDNLSSIVTGRAITSSYLRSSMAERKISDQLRNAAMAFMTLACIFAAISVFTAGNQNDLSTTLLRLSLALIFSVPAAYLARESAKHRKQQYEHLQISLDVAAITPYSASLPRELQDKLKEEMASRIFINKNFDHITKESYPINLQEALMTIAMIAKEKINEKEEKKEKPVSDSKE